MVHYFEAFDAVTSAGGSLVSYFYASIKSKTMMRLRVYAVSLSPSLLIIWSVKVSSMKLTTEFTALLLNTGRLSSTSHIWTQCIASLNKCDITRPHDGHVIVAAWRLFHLATILLLWKLQTVLASLLRAQHHYVGAKCLLARQTSVASQCMSSYCQSLVHKEVVFFTLLVPFFSAPRSTVNWC